MFVKLEGLAEAYAERKIGLQAAPTQARAVGKTGFILKGIHPLRKIGKEIRGLSTEEKLEAIKKVISDKKYSKWVEEHVAKEKPTAKCVDIVKGKKGLSEAEWRKFISCLRTQMNELAAKYKGEKA